MIRVMTSAVLVAIATALLCCGTRPRSSTTTAPADGAAEQSRPARGPFAPVRPRKALTLRIETPKREYSVGDPIEVSVSVENTGLDGVMVRKFVLLPADDPRNTVGFKISEAGGRKLARVSHTMTGRALLWPAVARLTRNKSYTKSFRLAGTYRRRVGKKVIKGPLWCFGEHPGILVANEYPVQRAGVFFVTAVYRNRDDGRKWPKSVGIGSGSVWTGRVVSNTLTLRISERGGRR